MNITRFKTPEVFDKLNAMCRKQERGNAMPRPTTIPPMGDTTPEELAQMLPQRPKKEPESPSDEPPKPIAEEADPPPSGHTRPQ